MVLAWRARMEYGLGHGGAPRLTAQQPVLEECINNGRQSHREGELMGVLRKHIRRSEFTKNPDNAAYDIGYNRTVVDVTGNAGQTTLPEEQRIPARMEWIPSEFIRAEEQLGEA